MSARLRLAVLVALGAIACVIGWAALAPIDTGSREEVFVIPKGTWARRMAGEKLEILPDEIHLTLGVRDVLVMQNHDDVPQMFGPVLMMPGQSFRLPFSVASTYPFACTAHLSGQLTVVVAPLPAPGWARLQWRFASIVKPHG